MTPPSPRFAWVCGSDASLSSLLTDVLGEAGVNAVTGAAPPVIDVVLLHVWGPPALKRLERLSSSELPQTPIVAVLPFADDDLARSAMKAGARGTFALGTPLDSLKSLVKDALKKPARRAP